MTATLALLGAAFGGILGALLGISRYRRQLERHADEVYFLRRALTEEQSRLDSLRQDNGKVHAWLRESQDRTQAQAYLAQIATEQAQRYRDALEACVKTPRGVDGSLVCSWCDTIPHAEGCRGRRVDEVLGWGPR